MELYYQYLLSKDGEVYKKSRRRVAHSFVTGFTGMLYASMGNTIKAIIDTGNTSRNIRGSVGFETFESAGSSIKGLVVGTGTNAVNVANYALQTKIEHGAGVGQLQYSASTIAEPSFVSSTSELILTRLFTNASGDTITVNEIGIYSYAVDDSSRYICLARDLATVEIANGSTLTLNYIIQTTL